MARHSVNHVGIVWSGERRVEGTARTRELLRGQTETEAEAVREELRRRFRERRGALRMPAVVSSGQKPL